MLVKRWDKLPLDMQNDSVRAYYEILKKKWFSLFLKRIFDIVFSFVLLIILSPLFLALIIIIRIDSKGPVFFKQERITQYCRPFKILKFRTMVENAESIGTLVTVNHDSRITRIGRFLRKTRLDEIPQLLNILDGDMTFVGTRPEVRRYVDQYTDEMKATLLLPAGVTSKASIEFKDEEKLLSETKDVDNTYLHVVLPNKMVLNCEGLKKFCIIDDIQIICLTIFSVFEKNNFNIG